MTTITIEAIRRTWTLTDEGREFPVLIDDQGCEYGPWDNVSDKIIESSIIGQYQNQVTARAIARYAKENYPDDQAVVAMVQLYQSTRDPILDNK